MKAFKFSLQALLTLREQEEQAALHAYARKLSAQERAVSAFHAVEDELSQAWNNFHQRMENGSPAVDLAQLQRFCTSTEMRRREAENAARLARQEAQESFLQLLMLRQARSVLEKLAERELERYLKSKRRKEQKVL